jgi:hypothetical protein
LAGTAVIVDAALIPIDFRWSDIGSINLSNSWPVLLEHPIVMVAAGAVLLAFPARRIAAFTAGLLIAIPIAPALHEWIGSTRLGIAFGRDFTTPLQLFYRDWGQSSDGWEILLTIETYQGLLGLTLLLIVALGATPRWWLPIGGAAAALAGAELARFWVLSDAAYAQFMWVLSLPVISLVGGVLAVLAALLPSAGHLDQPDVTP